MKYKGKTISKRDQPIFEYLLSYYLGIPSLDYDILYTKTKTGYKKSLLKSPMRFRQHSK